MMMMMMMMMMGIIIMMVVVVFGGGVVVLYSQAYCVDHLYLKTTFYRSPGYIFHVTEPAYKDHLCIRITLCWSLWWSCCKFQVSLYVNQTNLERYSCQPTYHSEDIWVVYWAFFPVFSMYILGVDYPRHGDPEICPEHVDKHRTSHVHSLQDTMTS